MSHLILTASAALMLLALGVALQDDHHFIIGGVRDVRSREAIVAYFGQETIVIADHFVCGAECIVQVLTREI